ncbi:UDP-N-acetylmuramoyl-tripeptide--D-alanyl-D-alanine ligase [bacterium]|nr:UDP-N-acetylmuramoyl-tripeptide--D-alanyl-D-alanine ligase [bacterium]
MEALTLSRIARALGLEPPHGADSVVVGGVSTDTRTLRAGDVFFALPGARVDGSSFVEEAFARGARAAVASSAPDLGRSRPVLRVPDARAALGRFAASYRDAIGATVVAITGSAGKTTTKEMLFHMVSGERRTVRAPKSFNNDVGVPLTILDADRSTEVIVVEVGTNHPGEIDALGAIARPDVAAITCVAAAHLEGLGSIEGVAREKAALLRHLRPGGTAVLNADDMRVRGMASALREARGEDSVVLAGFSDDASFHGRISASFLGDALTPGSIVLVKTAPLKGALAGWTRRTPQQMVVPVPGHHNARNALIALACCEALGVNPARAAEALATFRAPEGRWNVETIAGVTLIDDTYNANPASVTAALETFASIGDPRGRIVVLGGMLELGAHAAEHHRAVGRWVARIGVEKLVTVGDEARWIAEGAVRGGLASGRVRHAGTASEVDPALRPSLRPGAAILFKGSRRCGLDEAVRAIRGRLEADRRDGSGGIKRPVSGRHSGSGSGAHRRAP